MRSHLRTVVVLALACALLGVVSVTTSTCGVSWARSSARGPSGSLVSLAIGLVNLAIRALRWQYLLEPLGRDELRQCVSRDGRRVRGEQLLPARAGEVIRPYFLARQRPRADERDRRVRDDHPRAPARRGDGAGAAGVVRVRVRPRRGTREPGGVRRAQVGRRHRRRPRSRRRAGRPVRAGRRSGAARPSHARGSSRSLPSALAGLIARVAEKFARGLGADPPPGPAARRARVVVSALAVDWLSASGRSRWRFASPCRSPGRFC